MAVQKSRKTKSKRKKKYINKKIKLLNISKNNFSGEIHLNHFLTKEGFYGKNNILKNEYK